jgi:hypothetical protein
MPFTFAHPAAVLPLRKYLGRFGVLSALVIGSMSPDFVYFAPVGIHGSASHSIPGLFWFCIPIGLLIYLAFHRWLKQPLVSLLPHSVQRPIAPTSVCGLFQNLPAVFASLLIGALTHVAWDSFTHAKSPWQILRPILDQELFAIGSYQVFVFRVLQHSSTLLGTVLLAWWARQWYASSQAVYPVARRGLARTKMIIALAITSLFAAIAGLVAGLSAIGSRTGVLALQHFAVKAIVTAVPVFVVVFIGYCIWWQMESAAARKP